MFIFIFSANIITVLSYTEKKIVSEKLSQVVRHIYFLFNNFFFLKKIVPFFFFKSCIFFCFSLQVRPSVEKHLRQHSIGVLDP